MAKAQSCTLLAMPHLMYGGNETFKSWSTGRRLSPDMAACTTLNVKND